MVRVLFKGAFYYTHARLPARARSIRGARSNQGNTVCTVELSSPPEQIETKCSDTMQTLYTYRSTT